MSSLLKEAIVDANALREAALKHAETKIVDKYSDEVRQTLEALLEQDELGLDLGADPMAADPMAADPAATGEEDTIEEDVDDVPFAATDDLSGMEGENLKNVPAEGENVEVTLDLGSLKEAVQELQKEIDEELTFSEEDFAAVLSEDDADQGEAAEEDNTGAKTEAESDEFGKKSEISEDLINAIVGQLMEADGEALEEYATASSDDNDDKDDDDDAADDDIAVKDGPGKGEDNFSITKGGKMVKNPMEEELDLDNLVDAITEKLTVDMGADLSGWAGRPDFQQKYEIEKEMAHRRSTEVAEDMKVLKKAQEELVFENKQLTSKLTQYEQVTIELKETLQTVNLSNARLLYTNRVLRNTSLNERQKNRIVEAISKADSVAEARTIHNTLESTVESAPKRGPKSLSEAIHRPSSVIRATRTESKQADPFAERMRRLAGIK
jgi:hypothetical protein